MESLAAWQGLLDSLAFDAEGSPASPSAAATPPHPRMRANGGLGGGSRAGALSLHGSVDVGAAPGTVYATPAVRSPPPTPVDEWYTILRTIEGTGVGKGSPGRRSSLASRSPSTRGSPAAAAAAAASRASGRPLGLGRSRGLEPRSPPHAALTSSPGPAAPASPAAASSPGGCGGPATVRMLTLGLSPASDAATRSVRRHAARDAVARAAGLARSPLLRSDQGAALRASLEDRVARLSDLAAIQSDAAMAAAVGAADTRAAADVLRLRRSALASPPRGSGNTGASAAAAALAAKQSPAQQAAVVAPLGLGPLGLGPRPRRLFDSPGLFQSSGAASSAGGSPAALPAADASRATQPQSDAPRGGWGREPYGGTHSGGGSPCAPAGLAASAAAWSPPSAGKKTALGSMGGSPLCSSGPGSPGLAAIHARYDAAVSRPLRASAERTAGEAAAAAAAAAAKAASPVRGSPLAAGGHTRVTPASPEVERAALIRELLRVLKALRALEAKGSTPSPLDDAAHTDANAGPAESSGKRRSLGGSRRVSDFGGGGAVAAAAAAALGGDHGIAALVEQLLCAPGSPSGAAKSPGVTQPIAAPLAAGTAAAGEEPGASSDAAAGDLGRFDSGLLSLSSEDGAAPGGAKGAADSSSGEGEGREEGASRKRSSGDRAGTTEEDASAESDSVAVLNAAGLLVRRPITVGKVCGDNASSPDAAAVKARRGPPGAAAASASLGGAARWLGASRSSPGRTMGGNGGGSGSAQARAAVGRVAARSVSSPGRPSRAAERTAPPQTALSPAAASPAAAAAAEDAAPGSPAVSSPASVRLSPAPTAGTGSPDPPTPAAIGGLSGRRAAARTVGSPQTGNTLFANPADAPSPSSPVVDSAEVATPAPALRSVRSPSGLPAAVTGLGDGTPVTPPVSGLATATELTTPMLAGSVSAVKALSGAWGAEASGAKTQWEALLAEWDEVVSGIEQEDERAAASDARGDNIPGRPGEEEEEGAQGVKPSAVAAPVVTARAAGSPMHGSSGMMASPPPAAAPPPSPLSPAVPPAPAPTPQHATPPAAAQLPLLAAGGALPPTPGAAPPVPPSTPAWEPAAAAAAAAAIAGAQSPAATAVYASAPAPTPVGAHSAAPAPTPVAPATAPQCSLIGDAPGTGGPAAAAAAVPASPFDFIGDTASPLSGGWLTGSTGATDYSPASASSELSLCGGMGHERDAAAIIPLPCAAILAAAGHAGGSHLAPAAAAAAPAVVAAAAPVVTALPVSAAAVAPAAQQAPEAAPEAAAPAIPPRQQQPVAVAAAAGPPPPALSPVRPTLLESAFESAAMPTPAPAAPPASSLHPGAAYQQQPVQGQHVQQPQSPLQQGPQQQQQVWAAQQQPPLHQQPHYYLQQPPSPAPPPPTPADQQLQAHNHHYQQQQVHQGQMTPASRAAAMLLPGLPSEHSQFERLRAIHARLAAMARAPAAAPAPAVAAAAQPVAVPGGHMPPQPQPAHAPPMAAATAGGWVPVQPATAADGAAAGAAAAGAVPLPSPWLQTGPLQQVLLRQRQRDLHRRLQQQQQQRLGAAPAAPAPVATVPATAAPVAAAPAFGGLSLSPAAAQLLARSGGAAGHGMGVSNETSPPVGSSSGGSGGKGAAAPPLSALQRLVREGSPKRRLQRLRLLQQTAPPAAHNYHYPQQQHGLAAAAPVGVPSQSPGSPTRALRLARYLQAGTPSSQVAAGPISTAGQQQSVAAAAAAHVSSSAGSSSGGGGGVISGGSTAGGLTRLHGLTQQLQDFAQELRAAQQQQGSGGGGPMLGSSARLV